MLIHIEDPRWFLLTRNEVGVGKQGCVCVFSVLLAHVLQNTSVISQGLCRVSLCLFPAEQELCVNIANREKLALLLTRPFPLEVS